MSKVKEKVLASIKSKDIAAKFVALGLMTKKQAKVFLDGDDECLEGSWDVYKARENDHGSFTTDKNGDFHLTISEFKDRESDEINFSINHFHPIGGKNSERSFMYYQDGRVVQFWSEIVEKEITLKDTLDGN